jgi:hypothetical protein
LRDMRASDRVALVNRVLSQLHSSTSIQTDAPAQLVELSSIVGGSASTIRPSTPLSDSALLTNARDEPSCSRMLEMNRL